MSLKNFALSKAIPLARANAECIRTLRMLPSGELLADTYERLVGKEDIIRYGVIFPFLFEDWLDLSSQKRMELFERATNQILCLYALILELDDYQDSTHKKQFTELPASSEVTVLQKTLENEYNDDRSKCRTEWQNILIRQTLQLLRELGAGLNFDAVPLVRKFKDTVEKASETFILETIEDQKPGRLDEKLEIAANKNQMIIASAVILAPLARKGCSDLLYRTAMNMMLPIQLMDDLYDWEQDYRDKKYTTLLREVTNWDMSRDELYVFLTEQTCFQEMLNETLKAIDAVIVPLREEKIGTIVTKLFSEQKVAMAHNLQQVEQFYLFIKNQKEVT